MGYRDFANAERTWGKNFKVPKNSDLREVKSYWMISKIVLYVENIYKKDNAIPITAPEGP
jgi:hypothetical protein